jgi:ABC-type transport system substrate-binding protein
LVRTFEEQTGLKAKINLATDAGYIDLCEYIQRELQKIGIAIKVDVMPPATLKQARSQGKLEMFRSNWIADYPMPKTTYLFSILKILAQQDPITPIFIALLLILTMKRVLRSTMLINEVNSIKPWIHWP